MPPDSATLDFDQSDGEILALCFRLARERSRERQNSETPLTHTLGGASVSGAHAGNDPKEVTHHVQT